MCCRISSSVWKSLAQPWDSHGIVGGRPSSDLAFTLGSATSLEGSAISRGSIVAVNSDNDGVLEVEDGGWGMGVEGRLWWS